MHKILHWSCVMLSILMPLVFTACKDDKDDPVSLTVSPQSLSLLSDKGATVTFSITCNGGWTITEIPEWLNLSATSGNGDGTITVTALSANNDDVVRTASISVTAGEVVQQVAINQLAAFVGNCSVDFTDILEMTTSVAFQYQIAPDVSYFYAGYLDISSAGWTDEKIVNTLTDEDRFDPKNHDTTGLQGFSGMYSDTEYYLCAVAFNAKGEQGKLTKTKIRTKAYKSEVPRVMITNTQYSDTQWLWDTEMNAYTSRYYMIGMDGLSAFGFAYLYTEAEIAWVMRDKIDAGESEPIANSSSWSMSRASGAVDVFIATWGRDIDNNYSPMLEMFYCDVSANSSYDVNALRKVSAKPVRTHISAEQLERLMEQIHVFELK